MPRTPKPWVMPEIKAEYVGLREIAQRLECDRLTVLRRLVADPTLPIRRVVLRRYWAYAMRETDYRLYLQSIYAETAAHAKPKIGRPKGKKRETAIREIPPCGCLGCLEAEAAAGHPIPSTYSST